MHSSAKYSPWKHSKKKWACWPMSQGVIKTHIGYYLAQYNVYGWKCYIEKANQWITNPPRYEYNSWYFGAHQKENGAWKSGVRLSSGKNHANRKHRRKEKRTLQKCLSKINLEDGFDNFYIAMGYWD